ncbi:hypothetical protein BSKO_01325 [Bryopsis sp. KO-2023]|nr:hypothetical protein BSKO_01325 [Bryopsis sp. KO-2023]
MSTHHDQNESVQQTREATLCANNCGFFANPACMGFCSKCYRDISAREQRKVKEETEQKDVSGGSIALEGNAAPVQPPTIAADSLPGKSVAAPVAVPCPPAASTTASPAPARVSKKKCGVCSKKVGLTGFPCKCGRMFCGAHRYAEAHDCAFDHKTSERQRLAEDNPLVQASKLEKL